MLRPIDTSLLTKDYNTKIYKYGELINKNDLIYLYKTLNLSIAGVASVLGVKTSRVVSSIQAYGLTKTKQEILESKKQTSQRLYGVDFPSQAKWFRDRVKQTCISKYGVTNISQAKDVKVKKEATCLKNYGVKNPSQSGVIKKRKCRTCLKHYGVENHTQSVEFQKERAEAYLEKYGVTDPQQLHIKHKEIWANSDLFTDFIKRGRLSDTGRHYKYTTKDLMDFFGVTECTMAKHIRDAQLWSYIKHESCVAESEIVNFIESLGLATTKYRKDSLEIDVYIPNKKIGIEFNGNYWHSHEVKQNKNYHLNKTEKANSRGITVYHLFEYEWNLKRAQVESQLKNLLGINGNKIYARDCIIKDIQPSTEKLFLEENHIHGYASSSVRLGLFYKDELVSVMTFGKSRFNKKYEWELVRFCNKRDTTVTGGASKLFKHFVKTYNPTSIVSYSDIAKTKGTLYGILGFKTIGTTSPNYVWVYSNWGRNIKVLSRYQCQKHKLLEKGLGKKTETETQIMNKNRFFKLYDCGNRIHVWKPF